jgi:hypothetical protein
MHINNFNLAYLDPSFCSELIRKHNHTWIYERPKAIICFLTKVMVYSNYAMYLVPVGHTVTQWSRHCATSQKVAGSIPKGVMVIFH